MTPDEANRLLALSREARWTFPSSFGSPAAAGESSVERLVPERESFAEAALVLSDSGDEETATELAANVWRVWMMTRDVEGGLRFVSTVLDRVDGGPTRARALALYGAGLLALRAGELEESRQRNGEALEAARASGDPEALALACLGLSRVAFEDGDHERARSLAVEAREHAGSFEPALGQAPLHMQAQAVRLSGDYNGAALLFEESLALNRRIGDRGMVEVELQNLGLVELRRGNTDAATRYFEELGAAGDLDELTGAALAYARGDDDAAGALLARVDVAELPRDDRAELDWLRQALAEASS